MSSGHARRRVGIIGFGSIAENGHLPALQTFPGLELVAVADVSAERRDRARAVLPAATLFDSPWDLIELASVVVLDICSPPGTHSELLEAACARGIADIICEKPLVLTEEEYARVARARERSGSRIVSVNNYVHSDLNRAVRTVLAEDLIGQVRDVVLRTERTGAALGNAGWSPRWRTDLSAAGGGIVLDHGWHQLYLMLGWIGQPVESVRAQMRTADPRHHPVEDEAVVQLAFPAASGRIELCWTADGRRNDGRIRGSHGAITIYDDRIVVHNSAKKREIPFANRLTKSSYHPLWFRQMFDYTVVEGGNEEASRNFAEAGVLVSIISAAYRSAREGGAPQRLGIPGDGPGVGADKGHGSRSAGATTR